MEKIIKLSSEFNKDASKFLGQEGSYSVQDTVFNPDYLVPLRRDLVRKERGIVTSFKGEDIWHCRESTFLLDNGVPISGTLKISYSSDSEFMVESKSFKLFLNSFDMYRVGKTIGEAIFNYEEKVRLSLEQVLQTKVKTKFFRTGNIYPQLDPGEGFSQLESLIDIESLEISDYKTNSNLLKVVSSPSEFSCIKVYTSSLRSRCRYTKQKDTGTAFIEIFFSNYQTLSLESLFKYIVSYRTEDEFHEFCSEQIFTDLVSLSGVDDIGVMLLYSRRGSLDINPIRYSSTSLYNKGLQDICINTIKTDSQ